MRDLLSVAATAAGKARAMLLRNETPIPFSGSRSGVSLWSNGSAPTADALRAYDAHGSVGTLFAIVSQISWAFSTTDWHLYQRTSVRDKSRRKEVLGHPFSILWDMPNLFYPGVLFREAAQQYLDLTGESFIVLYKVGGVPIEMWVVRPERMQPVKHPTKFLTGWIYTGPEGEEVPLTTDQVIQLKYPNPDDPYRGRGPVQTILTDVDTSRAAAQWNRNFFLNGAQPGGVIKVDYKMGEREFNEFMERWRGQHQGVSNAHRVAVLENADYIPTPYSMEDMQFAQLRELPRELIREAFAFPKPMLGTVDDVNRANSEAAREIMAEGQTLPRLQRWKETINTFLLPQFANGKSLAIDFDDPIPPNKDQQNQTITAQSLAVRNLVSAGYHPEDSALVVGLPPMRWVGIPSPAQAEEAPADVPPTAAPAARR
jgi:HK97 family phage portal protein